MKKRILSLLLAAAMLVLLAVPAFAEDGHAYTYVALGDSITTGVGLKDTHFSSTAKSYDVQENYHDYSKDCYVARVADALPAGEGPVGVLALEDGRWAAVRGADVALYPGLAEIAPLLADETVAKWVFDS